MVNNMVMARYEYCRVCEKETMHHNAYCTICDAREYRNKIAAWDALPLEDKLNDLRRRVEALEQNPVRY
jgi:hypothetical protein